MSVFRHDGTKLGDHSLRSSVMFERETAKEGRWWEGNSPPPFLRCSFLNKYLEFRMPESAEGMCAKNHNHEQKTCAEILKLTANNCWCLWRLWRRQPQVSLAPARQKMWRIFKRKKKIYFVWFAGTEMKILIEEKPSGQKISWYCFSKTSQALIIHI